MRRGTRIRLESLIYLAIAGSSALALPPSYTAIELPGLGGTGHSYAYDINDDGLIVGNSPRPDGTFAACYWQSGLIYELPPLGSALNSAYAQGINALGVIVGGSPASATYPYNHAVQWNAGTISELFASGMAYAINSSGVVVGGAYTEFKNYRPVKLENGVLTDLGIFPGARLGEAKAINDAGDIVGNGGGPALWKNGKIINLPPISGPNHSGEALAINNAGQIVGSTQMGNQNIRACIWENDGATVRPLQAVGLHSADWANDINDAGVPVGNTLGPALGFIWENGVRVAIDDIAHGVDQMRIIRPHSINNHGDIVGEGRVGPVGNYRYPAALYRPDPAELTLAPPTPGIAGEINTLTVFGLEPGTTVTFIASRAIGLTVLSGCPGRVTSLKQAQTLGSVAADESGSASIDVLVPQRANRVPVYFQAYSASACEVSNLVPYAFR